MTITVLQEEPSVAISLSGTVITSTAFTSNCTVGSTMAFWLLVGSSTTLPNNVTDSASQVYTLQKNVTLGGASAFALYVFQNNQSATKLTITATWTVSQSFVGVWPAEIGGTATSSFQVAVSNTQSSPPASAGSVTTGSITPTSQPCLLYALTFLYGGTQILTPTSNTGTPGGNGWGVGGPPSFAISEWIRLTSTAATSATFTPAETGDNFGTIGAIFTEFVNVGPPPVAPYGPMPKQIYIMP